MCVEGSSGCGTHGIEERSAKTSGFDADVGRRAKTAISVRSAPEARGRLGAEDEQQEVWLRDPDLLVSMVGRSPAGLVFRATEVLMPACLVETRSFDFIES